MRLIFAFWTWHPDVNNHFDWGIRIFEYTPAGFYAPEANVWSHTWPNQPPGTIYIFALSNIIFEYLFNFLLFINNSVSIFPSIIVSFSETNLYPALLQLPAIISDFGIAYLIYKITKSKFASIIFLVNPVIWYNSSVWGQYDSIINFLMLLGFYAAYKKDLTTSVIAVALSLYIKISLVILVPVYAIYILKNFKLINILKTSILSLLLVIILTLPFSDSQNPIIWLYKLYTEKVLSEQLHLITANAFNFWALVRGVSWVPNSEPLLGKTFEFWGLILFAIISLPLYIRAFFTQEKVKILFITGMIYFTAWMFLTNMHERYLYPVFVFTLPYIFLRTKKVWIYLSLGILSTFNMYFLWYVPKFEFLMDFANSTNKRIIAFLFLFFYLVLYLEIFDKRSSKIV